LPRTVGYRRGLLTAGLFSLALLARGASEPHAERRQEETLVPGLRHIALSRGSRSTATRFRVLVGSFESQAQADRLLARLERAALASERVGPHYQGGRYHVALDGLGTRAEAESAAGRLRAAGFANLVIEDYDQDSTHPQGPWEIHLLEARPESVEVRVAHAYDTAIGLETTSGIARRLAALAAVNGGYFLQQGLLRGEAQGAFMMEGVLLSEPDRNRAAVGFFEEAGRSEAVFGRLGFRGRLRLADGREVRLDGLNRARGPAEILLFTPEFHRTTLTSPEGTEVVVEDGRIAAVRVGAGSTPIPANGLVVSLARARARELPDAFRVGAPIKVMPELVPLLPDAEAKWKRAQYVVGGGPLLVFAGRRVEEPEAESISRVFFLARHPRTGVGLRADGTLLFVTVDGRQPEKSAGMSLAELTDLFLELGAVYALNLDGGGSTTMVIRGRTVNSPSDPGGERAGGDAILIYPRRPGAFDRR
jgi:hypothetical protein